MRDKEKESERLNGLRKRRGIKAVNNVLHTVGYVHAAVEAGRKLETNIRYDKQVYTCFVSYIGMSIRYFLTRKECIIQEGNLIRRRVSMQGDQFLNCVKEGTAAFRRFR